MVLGDVNSTPKVLKNQSFVSTDEGGDTIGNTETSPACPFH